MSARKRDIAEAWDSLGGPTPERVAPSPGARQSVLDTFAPPKKKRQWEKDHQPMTIRGMDRALDERLLEISLTEGITKDWAANVLLHYACYLYENDKLPVNPQPGPRKMTLFPTEGASSPAKRVWWEKSANPQKRPAAAKPPRAKKEKKAPAAKAEFIASYRFDAEVRAKLKPLLKVIRTGDVVVYFLGRAIADYDAGALSLVPVEAE